MWFLLLSQKLSVLVFPFLYKKKRGDGRVGRLNGDCVKNNCKQ